MVAQEIRDIIERFIVSLGSRGVHVDKALLYGSFAHGTQNEDSDVDIAVVSCDFGRDRFSEGRMLMQLAWRIDPRLHPVPVAMEAYLNDTWVPLIHEIREHGIDLA
jgi:predicted nucleotidyltransferase